MIFKRLANLIKDSELLTTLLQFRREFLWAGILSMFSNLLALAPSLYMLQVFDRVIVGQSTWTLIFLSGITVFMFVMLALAEWLRSTVLIQLGEKIDATLGQRIFDASFQERMLARKSKGAHSLSDLTELRRFLSGTGTIAFFDAPWTPIYLAILFLLHPLLGWLALGGAILLLIMAWLTERFTSKPFADAQEADRLAEGFIQRKLRSAEVIESMGMLEGLRQHWQQRHFAHMAVHCDAQDMSARIKSLTKFIRYSIQSLILCAGAFLVIDGVTNMWVIIVANMLLARALAPLDQAIGSWRSFVTARISFKRLDTLLREHPPLHALDSRSEPRGEIKLVGISVTLEGRNKPILDNLNLLFPAGETIAVIGPSASGKSTLARVILGIWAPECGEILLDGELLNSWSREKIGPKIGYLPQDVQLLDGSISQNIARFGEVDSEKVIQAAKLAGVHEMIQHFSQGYDSPVGANGGYLSGGQRQRIGLARALYGNPCLVILDEPNSNLDDQGDAALRNAIIAMQKAGSSVILITHRTGILNVVDRILVMQQGSVQRFGRREDFPGSTQSNQGSPSN